MNSARLLVIVASLWCFGCGQTESMNEATPVAPMQSATRIQAQIQRNSVPAAESAQMATSGTVMEVGPNSIKVKNEQFRKVTINATSADVEVWENGELVQLTSLKSGDRVDLFSEQRGNPMDGYQSLVVRGNISSRANEDDQTTKDYSRTIRGVVVEADSHAVTIRDRNNFDASLTIVPVVHLVEVTKDGKIGSTSLLSPGDNVELTVRSVGNRMDGYIDTATEIVVDQGRQ